MKRLIVICTALLLVQTGLLVMTNLIGHEKEIQPGKGPMLSLQASLVNELLLEDSDGHRLRLKKDQDKWVLPDLDSFPADSKRIQELVDRLAGMQRGWPEATTDEAANRFKVAPDHFEHKLSLSKDGTALAVVYFGNSPGLRKIYLRVDGGPEIQTIALPPQDLQTKADDWIDTGVLRLKPEQVTQVDLPELRLERGKDGLQPTDLRSDEEVVKERRDQLVERLCELRITSVLGKEIKPEYGLDKPVLRYSVHLEDGATIDYLFGKQEKAEQKKDGEGAQPAAGQSYVLRVSNREQVFLVDGWQVEEINNVTRAGLVRAKTDQAPAKQPDEPVQGH